MKKELRWALAAVALLSLSGCGLKGPLYFPPADKPKVSTAPSDSGDVQKNQQSSSGTQSTSSSADM